MLSSCNVVTLHSFTLVNDLRVEAILVVSTFITGLYYRTLNSNRTYAHATSEITVPLFGM